MVAFLGLESISKTNKKFVSMQRVLNLWRSMLSAQRGKRDREGKREKSSVSLLCEFLLINSPHYRTEIAKVNRHTYEYIVDIVKVCQSMTSYREYLAISFCFQIRSDTGSYLAYSWAALSIRSYDPAYRIEISDAKNYWN